VKSERKILQQFKSKTGQLAVLIDPEKSQDRIKLLTFLSFIAKSKVDFIFIGGSTGTKQEVDFTIRIVKENCALPIVLFPGNPSHVSDQADALLYLSLNSGRNADFLIGLHVESAEKLWSLNIEKIPTSYLLLDGGIATSVEKVSKTKPMAVDDFSMIHATVKASIMLGQQVIYLDGGSGAKNVMRSEVITEIKNYSDAPLLIGGGITTKKQFDTIANAGANVVVIGNAFESDPSLVLEFI
jgi:phosphoglycerol geranylgeranyltransferase